MVSLTQRDEYRLRVFENGILRKTFGCKGKGIKGDRRLQHMGSFAILLLTKY
jgi:hypothetical protein